MISALPRIQRMLLIGAGALALLFWLNIGFSILRPSTGSFLLKWIPSAILACIIYLNRQSFGSLLVFCALLFQSMGAVILDFDRHGNVLYALAFTAIGHILFAAAYFQKFRRPTELSTNRKILFGLFLLYAICYGTYIALNVPTRMQIPVGVYMLCLTAAVLLSVSSSYFWLVCLGMLCFAFDDSIFSFHLFIAPIGPNHFITWPSYMAGQTLVTIGFLSHSKE